MKVMHNAYVCLEFIIEEGQVLLESESFYLYLYAYVYTNTCAVQGIRASAWLVWHIIAEVITVIIHI